MKQDTSTSIIHETTIGDCRLILGNSLDVLPGLGRFDCVVTDPPYRLVSGGNSTGEMGGCFSKDRYDNSGSIVDCDIDWSDWIPILDSVMASRSHGYIMSNNRHVANCMNAVEAAGFHFHNLLVWDKRTATPNRWYMKNCEFTVFFSKGKAFSINGCGAKQLVHVPARDISDHPTEKPVALMEHYIRQSTQPGDSVLDPFTGVGSTAVAAIRSGRRFTGIEINEKWYRIACQRCQYEADNLMHAQSLL